MVIDILRATTVMIVALSNGALHILPAATLEDARSILRNNPGALLCGERDGMRIEGFDLGNSPLEYTPERVSGKTVVLTTSNGTKTIHACSRAHALFIGAFVNLDALVSRVGHFEELVIACSGTNGRFSMDDAMCAGYIIQGIQEQTKVSTDDLGNMLLKMVQPRTDLKTALKDCFHVNYLMSKGFAADLDVCLQFDTYPVVPVVEQGKVILTGEL